MLYRHGHERNFEPSTLNIELYNLELYNIKPSTNDCISD